MQPWVTVTEVGLAADLCPRPPNTLPGPSAPLRGLGVGICSQRMRTSFARAGFPEVPPLLRVPATDVPAPHLARPVGLDAATSWF